MDCLDVVAEGVDAPQHLAALITGLQVSLLILKKRNETVYREVLKGD